MLVYKCPGRHHGPEGKTYDYKDVTELDKAILDGWFPSLVEAVNGELKMSDPDVNEAYKDGKGLGGFFKSKKSAERIELEKQASELGLEYHPKLGDKKLKQLIDEKLAE
jgi:hypothetical protein